MPTRQKAHNRCPRCSMRQLLCVCPDLPSLRLATRVTILMHYAEHRKTTNTGRLAALALENSEIRIRGDRSRPMSTEGLVSADYETLLLFPSADAVELTPALARTFVRPVQLVVSDGNWSQAGKVAKRESVLRAVPRVKLAPGKPSLYFLRQSPHRQNLSTFEAIARALGVLEGEAVERRLETLFELVIARTLWSRGVLPLEACAEAIPEAAVRAFYEDGCAGRSGPPV